MKGICSSSQLGIHDDALEILVDLVVVVIDLYDEGENFCDDSPFVVNYSWEETFHEDDAAAGNYDVVQLVVSYRDVVEVLVIYLAVQLVVN